MPNYLVKNANNKVDLICVSYNKTQILIRLFGRYNGSIDNLPKIPRNGIEFDMSEYQGGSVLTDYDGTNYTQRWTRMLSYEENQLQAGGTYIVVTNDLLNYVFRLDADKYPDLDISDWKFVRSRSLRPILKFTITSGHQDMSEVNKVYYLSSGIGSTKIISPDTIDTQEYEDKDTSLIPKIEYSILGSTITFVAKDKITVPLHLANCVNLQVNSRISMIDGIGSTTFVKPVDFTAGTCDVLFGFTKIATLTV